MKTMADGIAVGRPGDLTFAAVRDHVDEIVTVSEDSLSRALLALLERAKLVVEPAGAAAVAALLDDPTGVRGARRGGAVRRQHRPAAARQGDPARHGRRRALPQPAGLHPRRARRPGQLLTEVGEAGANVLEVVHERISPSLHLDEVEVHLQLETRGEPHAERVLARLRERGYRVYE